MFTTILSPAITREVADSEATNFAAFLLATSERGSVNRDGKFSLRYYPRKGCGTVDDCKALDEVRDLLLKQQVDINDRLRHEHDKLTQNEQLRARHQDLIREIKMHGRAVRQSVELQHQADAAIDRGDVEEAKRLMAQAAQALPDASNLPAVPRDISDKSKDVPAPDPDKGKEPAPAPQPAPPAPERPADKAGSEPKEKGAHRAPASPPDAPSPSDSSGMEARIKAHFDQSVAHFDQGLGSLRAQVEALALPDGYREVLEDFSPDDLRAVLKAGHWLNSKKWKSKKDKSESSHDNGVAEDGDPN